MVLIEEGGLSEAMLASSSFPGLYEPFRCKNRLLTDGGILNRLLVSIARSKGADIVIFCDVSLFTMLSRNRMAQKAYQLLQKHVEKKREKLKHKLKRITIRYIFFKFFCIVIDNRHVHEQFKKAPPDFSINPSVKKIRPLQFGQVDALYRAGREAAMEVIQEIRREMQ